MKHFLIAIAVLVVFFTSAGISLAQGDPSDGIDQAAPSPPAGFIKAQNLLNGSTDTLPGNKEMFNYISELVEKTKNLPAESASAGAPLVFGQEYNQIGTFDNWTMWIGWNGSFSDSYAPESESYAWVVYFAPEGVYVALQSAVSVYSGISVFGSIGSFWGALASPDGAIVKKDYLSNLYGVQISRGNSVAAPVGALSSLGLSFDTGLTFFRPEKSTQLQRGVQYNGGFTVSYDLISFPLPISVSLDRECTTAEKGRDLCAFHGFYPIIDWSTMPAVDGTPIDIVTERLKTLAATSGTTFTKIMGSQFAKTLLPFFSNIRTPGPVTLTNNDLPTTAQFLRQFLQNNRISVPATSPKPSVDHFITSVQKWLTTGDTAPLSTEIKQSSKVLADPPEVFKKLGAGTGLGFEMAYKYAADYYHYSQTFANCAKNVTCEVGKTCTITVTADEIAALVTGSTAAQFEGTSVWFNNPPEKFLASGYDWTGVPVKSGKAVFRFTQNTTSPTLIGPQVDPAAVTNNKTIKLCRRVASVSSTLPTVTISAVDPTASESGNTGQFVITRTGDTSQDLIVKLVIGGSATGTTDYKALASTKKIPAGHASVGITVVPVADNLNETKETVVIRLSNDAAYSVGLKSTASVSISNAL